MNDRDLLLRACRAIQNLSSRLLNANVLLLEAGAIRAEVKTASEVADHLLLAYNAPSPPRGLAGLPAVLCAPWYYHQGLQAGYVATAKQSPSDAVIRIKAESIEENEHIGFAVAAVPNLLTELNFAAVALDEAADKFHVMSCNLRPRESSSMCKPDKEFAAELRDQMTAAAHAARGALAKARVES